VCEGAILAHVGKILLTQVCSWTEKKLRHQNQVQFCSPGAVRCGN